MIKRILGIVAVASFVATSAIAADMPTYRASIPVELFEAPTPYAVSSFNGPFVGVFGAWSRNAEIVTINGTNSSIKEKGGDLGIQVGDYLEDGRFVFGGVFTAELSGQKGQAEYRWDCFDQVDRAKEKFLATAEARLGYEITPTIMAFGLAGLAAGEFSHSTHVVNTITGHTVFDGTANYAGVGSVLGAGIAVALSQMVSVEATYKHFDFGTVAINTSAGNASLKNKGDELLIGLNVRY